MTVGAGGLTHRVPISGGPTRLGDRRFGPGWRHLAKFVMARLPKIYAAALATLLRHGTGAGPGLKTAGLRKAFAGLTELGQQGRGEQVAGAGPGRKKRLVWMLAKQFWQSRDLALLVCEGGESVLG